MFASRLEKPPASRPSALLSRSLLSPRTPRPPLLAMDPASSKPSNGQKARNAYKGTLEFALRPYRIPPDTLREKHEAVLGMVTIFLGESGGLPSPTAYGSGALVRSAMLCCWMGAIGSVNLFSLSPSSCCIVVGVLCILPDPSRMLSVCVSARSNSSSSSSSRLGRSTAVVSNGTQEVVAVRVRSAWVWVWSVASQQQ